MSISTLYAPVSYTGDGVSDEFPVTWGINASSEIVVTETVIATGVETIKTLTTHYTVTGTGPVTVTAVTPPASTVRWTIGRNVPSTQLVDYVENDSFPAATHEAALDKLTMLSQEHDQNYLRTLHQPDGDSTNIAALPAKVDRASKFLWFDADGDPTGAALLAADVLVTKSTWLPVVTCVTPGDLSVAYSATRFGEYVKVGPFVLLSGRLIFTPTHPTASGSLTITAAPYTHAGGANAINAAVVAGNTNAAYASFTALQSNTGTITIIKQKTDTTENLLITDLATGVEATIYFTILLIATS